MATKQALCKLCGEPMPPGEEMFKFHGYSGPCPTKEKPANLGGPIQTVATPEERLSIDRMFEAWAALKRLGWRDAQYCPKDGREFDVIEAGSTGIHRCIYMGEWPTGTYMVLDGGDLYPSRPVLFRAREAR